MLKFSECMRSHGVSGFPDPSTSQGQNAIGIDGYNFNLPSNLNLQSPAFKSAQKTCGNLIAGGSGPPRGFSPVKAESRGAGPCRVHAPAWRPRLPRPESQRKLSGDHSQVRRPGNRPSITRFPKGPEICQPQTTTVPSHEPADAGSRQCRRLRYSSRWIQAGGPSQQPPAGLGEAAAGDQDAATKRSPGSRMRPQVRLRPGTRRATCLRERRHRQRNPPRPRARSLQASLGPALRGPARSRFLAPARRLVRPACGEQSVRALLIPADLP